MNVKYNGEYTIKITFEDVASGSYDFSKYFNKDTMS